MWWCGGTEREVGPGGDGVGSALRLARGVLVVGLRELRGHDK
jgi:hypothetical protein